VRTVPRCARLIEPGGDERPAKEQESGDWYSYSGELTVAIVAKQPGGGARWLWEVSGAGRPHGWRNSGHRTTALAARRAADEYWSRWLQAAALKPDVNVLAKASLPAAAERRKPPGRK
jgi:hypothetical protein